jgi:hypothetical protein
LFAINQNVFLQIEDAAIVRRLLVLDCTKWLEDCIPALSDDIVKSHEQKPGRAQLSREVLTYLIEHPHAQDTLEGIVGWWLLQQQIEIQSHSVKQVLDELVTENLIIEIHGPDSRVHYRLNPAKQEEISTLLEG